MTDKEAIATLQTMEYELSNQVGSKYCQKKYEAVDIAIKALEQEPVYFPPCVDCNTKMNEIREAYDKLKNQESCEDAISRQAVLDELRTCFDTHSIYDENNGENYIIYEDAVDMMEKLPSVTPTRKVGKWNKGVKPSGLRVYICSNCGSYYPLPDGLNFCPNCGAEMESEN